MKIIDINNNEVKACAWFEYRGFVVSSSTIVQPLSIAVYPASLKMDADVVYQADTVSDALIWIDRKLLNDIAA